MENNNITPKNSRFSIELLTSFDKAMFLITYYAYIIMYPVLFFPAHSNDTWYWKLGRIPLILGFYFLINTLGRNQKRFGGEAWWFMWFSAVISIIFTVVVAFKS